MQLPELYDGSLDQSRQCNGFISTKRYIADPKFEGGKVRMRPYVPPDLFRIINAVSLDEEIDEPLVFTVAGKSIRDVCTWKFIEYFAAVGF